MKKLIIVFVLLVASPVMASECLFGTQFPLVKVTKEESESFARHLSMAVGFSKKVVAEGKISELNPMHVMLNKLHENLVSHNGDIVKMIEADKDLRDNIGDYIHNEENSSLISFGLEQISKKAGDVNAAREYVKRTRILLASNYLQQRRPNYSQQWIGEIQTNDRIDFMNRNENYPLDENAARDYTATFIYQLLLAPKTD
jgi:hypothetical protein